MKKLLLIAIFLLLFIFTNIIPTSAYNENQLVWLIKPELEYDVIYGGGGFFNFLNYPQSGMHLEDIDFSFIETELNKNIYDFGDGKKTVELRPPHGGGWSEYFFDEKKAIFVVSYGNESSEIIEYYSPDDFSKDWFNNEKWLIAVRTINSEKVEYNEHGFYDKLETGDKYALVYGATFVTDYIYDEHKTGIFFHYSPDEFINVKSNGKWGVSDSSGNAAIPFIFDDFTFINDDFAFAKYNGKYGILDVKNTMLQIPPVTSNSPATGDNTIYVFTVLSMSVLLTLVFSLKKLKFTRSLSII